MTDHKKKLIEVALPLEAINREAAREKSIRHGHPSTLHLWWARRPLAACRAVLFAQLVDDPSAHPDIWPTQDAQDAERQRLFGIIERLVKWENSNNEGVLAEARAEIWRSCGNDPPPVFDPFCGGGSIPLEAQRLGLEADAGDLNPVAVLITKALVEMPSQFANRPPAHSLEGRVKGLGDWTGAKGLAEDVLYYGEWVRKEAESRLGHLYPAATLPDGSRAKVIAWIWVRTVTCSNPACRSAMPLARTFWLGKRKGKEAWLRPVRDKGSKRLRFEVDHGREGPPEGTVGRNGATCLICGSPVPLTHIRIEGKGGRLGVQLVAIVAEVGGRRVYQPADDMHEMAADVSRPQDVPETEMPYNPRYLTAPNYGMQRHADLFTNRQLTALTTLTDLVVEARERVMADSGDAAYSNAVATYLALAVSRTADITNALVRWSISRDQAVGLFSRQAIPMLWDFAEVNPFAEAAGDLRISLRSVSRVIERLPANHESYINQADATSAGGILTGVVISTDPPYYDNVGYADLADFFYVWLRRSLGTVYPELFTTLLTPKVAELVADPFRRGDAAKAEQFFEQGFTRAFSLMRTNALPGFPLTIFYAFKQAEDDPPCQHELRHSTPINH